MTFQRSAGHRVVVLFASSLAAASTSGQTSTVWVNARPRPSGLVSAVAGQTWRFQAWHRDANPLSTSNFTDAVTVAFF